MSKILLLIFAGIVIVGTVLIYSLIRPKNNSRTNRYTKKTPHVEPSLGSNPLEAAEYVGPVVTKSVDSVKTEPEQKLDALGLNEAPAAQENKHREAIPEGKPPTNPMVMLYLMASEKSPYTGYELLQSLLSAGLRFGEMQIFHRHEQKTGRGKVLFSLAAATKQGYFELPKMGGFSCKGLVLFIDLNKSANPKLAYETMLETAGQLSEDLGGRVLDENKTVLTKDKARETIASIRAFEKSQQPQDLFA